MKRKSAKGFTLIELIVVLAIFSIILASATSLMIPTSKIMITTEVQENGNAAATNYSRLLESSLSTTEYLQIYGKLDDATRKAKVKNFANVYYGGVIKAGTKPTDSTINYASMKVHVLEVDNTQNGRVTEWVYDIPSLKLDATDIGNPAASGKSVVNEAYYANYSFELKPGRYDTVESFDAATITNYPAMFTASDLSMTVKATATRSNGDTFSFLSNASTPMLNATSSVFNGAVAGVGTSVRETYYCITTPAGGTAQISDRGTAQAPYTEILSRLRVEGPDDGVGEPEYPPTSDCLTFIYSYGTEVNTAP
jgi:prepilin-type N-terminal cleavage/methylation domain-containing protein